MFVMVNQVEQIKQSVDKIYDQCINDLKDKSITSPNYRDASGITTCFTFNHQGFFDNGGSSDDHEILFAMGNQPYNDLKEIADNINSRISKRFAQSKFGESTYQPREEDVHITAASVINPSQNIIHYDWNYYRKEVKGIIEQSNLSSFKITFHRLFVGEDGIVVMVGYPDNIQVGIFKELMFDKFKAEKWWFDYSAAPVIGYITKDLRCEEAQNLLDSVQVFLASGKTIVQVNGLYLIDYTNRKINPTAHVRKIKYFPL